MSHLKQLIRECITEVQMEEGALGSFLGGGIAGYITAWATRNKPKAVSQREVNDVAYAAQDYKNSVENLRDALEPYAGTTSTEKYDSFLKTLGTISIDHIKPIKPKRLRRK